METNGLLHDNEAEVHVVGGLLNYEECYYSVSDRIKACMFSNPKIAKTVEVIIQLYNDGSNVNTVTVNDYLYAHPDFNNPEVWELAEYSMNSIVSAFEDSFNIVESLYIRRRYFLLGTKLMDFGTNLTRSYEEIQQSIADVLSEGSERKKRVKSLQDANAELKQRVLRNYDGTSDTMIPTGFTAIDEKGGFQCGDFNVIAAESSAGKTSLMTCIMVNASSKGIPCMIYSMEMMSSQIAARIAAPLAGVSSGIMQYKRLNDWQMNEVSQALKKTDGLPIYFDDDSTVSADSIISSIRANVKRLGVKLVGIDYLQILSSVDNGRNTQEQFLGTIARRLKNLAKELQICIVALSQLARNNNDPKPTLGRVRASGQIVEAADTVVLIWRPSEYNMKYEDFNVATEGTAELMVEKGRNIGTFHFIVGFEKEKTRFYNYDGPVNGISISSVDKKKKIERKEPEAGELPF